MSKGTTVSDVLETLSEASGEDRVSVGDVMDEFGRRAYGPIIFLIGAVSLSPVGAIPGASILFGVMVVLLMGQYLLKDNGPWLPGWVERASVSADKADKVVEKVKPYAEKLERYLKPRAEWVLDAPWTYLIAIVCIIHAATMFPLALVPWGVMPPSAALAVFGLGIMSRDGAFIIAGFVISVLSFGFAVWMLL